MNMYRNILVLISIIICVSCSELSDVYTEPVLITKEPGIKTYGALLSAEFHNVDLNDILSYGFYYNIDYMGVDLPDSTDLCYETSGALNQNLFSFHLQGGFKENVTYNVRAFIKTNSSLLYGNNRKIYLTKSRAPIITSIIQEKGIPSSQINIIGKYFPSRIDDISIVAGDIEADILQVNGDTIVIDFRQALESFTSTISISFYNKKVESSTPFTLLYPWSVRSSELHPSDHQYFSLKDKSFVVFKSTGIDKILNIFFTSSNAGFTEICDLPEDELPETFTLSTSQNDTAYLLINNNLYKFEDDYSFTYITQLPVVKDRFSYMFAHEDNIYIGSIGDSLHAYNLKSGSWISKSPLVCSRPRSYDVETCGNEIFMVLGYSSEKTKIYTYSIEYNKWEEFESLPFFSRYNTGQFFYKDHFYIGVGYGNIFYSEFWRYHLVKKKWQRLAYCPENVLSSLSFLFGDRGVIFSKDESKAYLIDLALIEKYLPEY